jgi:hypothetical protein
MYVSMKSFATSVACSLMLAQTAHALCAFDVGGQPEASAASDGALFVRASANANGTALTNGTGATRTAADILSNISVNTPRWDVNGSGGAVDATDAAIIARYLAGFRGAALIPGGAGPGATRTTGAQIDDYISNGCPIPNQPVTLAGAQFDPATRSTVINVIPESESYAVQRRSTFRWSDYRSTGTYAQPNEQIQITVGAAPAGTRVEALIGTWQQGSGIGSWAFAPQPYTLTPNGTTTISRDVGGPVYVRATNAASGGAVRFQITGGGTQMPLFLLGRDNHAQWVAALNAPNVTPYVEVVSHRAMITFKTDKVKAALATDPGANIARSAVLFDRLLASHDSVSGLDNSSPRDMRDDHPLHYTSHDDPTYYFFAFYYRTAFQQDFANVLFTKTFLTEEPGWGVWHETGHMYQGAWEWNELIEVSVNIYSLEFGRRIGVPHRLTLYDDGSSPGVKIWDRALQLRSTIAAFENLDVSQMLTMFWQLRLAYGPSFYAKLHKFYRDPATRPALPDNESRRQQFIVSASRVAGQDLRAYFNSWKLIATPATDAQVLALGLPAANVTALLALRPQ